MFRIIILIRCGEEAMEKVEGVLCAESGYTGECPVALCREIFFASFCQASFNSPTMLTYLGYHVCVVHTNADHM